MTLFIALSVLLAVAAAQITPYCTTMSETPTNIVNDCNTKCQYKCGTANCELTHTGGGSSTVSCGGGASSTIAPFCPPTLDSPGPSSTTPCGDGCQFTCTGSAGSSMCTLTLDRQTNMWGVKCGGGGGAPTIAPFCPTALNSPGPSSTTPCGDGCQYTCTGPSGYASCTLTLAAQWNVQCSNTVPIGSTTTAPGNIPPGQTTTFVQQQTSTTQQTAAPGVVECPSNSVCATQLPGCINRYCGCVNGQLTQYSCRDSGSTTTTAFVGQPTQPTNQGGQATQPTQATLPQFTTQPQAGAVQCNVATICDPFVAQGGKQCSVAQGAQCFCNAQGQVYSKTCPAVNVTPGGGAAVCTAESMSLCQQQCTGSQAACDCNADGSVRGVKCNAGNDDNKGDASSLGATMATVVAATAFVVMQFN